MKAKVVTVVVRVKRALCSVCHCTEAKGTEITFRTDEKGHTTCEHKRPEVKP